MVNNTLPQPDNHSQKHAEIVSAVIQQVIAERGPIPFAEFMKIALYEPTLGYYSNSLKKFGKEGDFITAPEISPLYTTTLTHQIVEILIELKQGDVLEFGAGSGVMATDILLTLEKLGHLPERYYILELSAQLKERQQQLISQRAPQLLNRVTWLDRLPSHFNGIILANEVVDAMPIHKFKLTNHQEIREYYVDYQDKNFCWHLANPGSSELHENIEQLNLPPNYISEINLLAPAWIASLAECLERGVILISDYGFPAREYYHPSRHMGTLMCHFRHHAHDDPLIYTGIQDITCHVNFTQLATAAVNHGLDISGYTHQAAFLLNCGIADLLGHPEQTENYFKQTQAIKQLTLPSEMGELFKVIALTKDYQQPLRGFSHMNHLMKLS